LREQHKKAAARAASTNGSGGHWEHGLCSCMGSLRFSCDLKEFKHVASTVPTGPPLSPSILTLGIHAGSHQAPKKIATEPWLSISTPDAKCLIRDILASLPAFSFAVFRQGLADHNLRPLGWDRRGLDSGRVHDPLTQAGSRPPHGAASPNRPIPPRKSTLVTPGIGY
jgi:hypothetical protein